MKYMLLYYTPETDWSGVPEDAQQAEMERWMTYAADMEKAGVFIGGHALQPVATATSVRVQGGKDLVTDGPFAETKETLGGYDVIDVPSVDEAIEWAKRCPAAADGTVELRPVLEFDMPEGAD